MWCVSTWTRKRFRRKSGSARTARGGSTCESAAARALGGCGGGWDRGKVLSGILGCTPMLNTVSFARSSYADSEPLVGVSRG